MRVTFVHPGTTRLPGGGTKVVYEHANQLVGRGHEVSVICPYAIDLPSSSLRGQIEHMREWYRARLSTALSLRLGSSALRWLRVDPRVRFFFVPSLEARFIPDADAVFATWWRTAEWVQEYPSNKGEKFYLIQGYETWGGPKDRVDATWRAPLNKIVISRWLRDLAVSMGVNRFRYIPNGIDHGHFRITIPPSERQMSVLSLYSEAECKRSEDALKILDRFHSRYREAPVTMFAVSPRSRTLPPWIKYFRNPSPHILRDLYNSHSVYLAASRSEGWALPPAEAMACGCAFIGTDIGGFRDYGINGRTALLSPLGDLDAMHQNLCRIAEDRQLRTRLQVAGTEYIRQFTWSRSGQMLHEYLLDIVKHESHPAMLLQNCSSQAELLE